MELPASYFGLKLSSRFGGHYTLAPPSVISQSVFGMKLVIIKPLYLGFLLGNKAGKEGWNQTVR